MNEQFIPYEQALELKELGFNEVCFACYNKDRELNKISEWHPDLRYLQEHPKICLAPLWQQAFDWFELKHKLYSVNENVVLSFGIVDCRNNNTVIIKPIDHDDTYKSREEVRLECLKKIIELCNNGK